MAISWAEGDTAKSAVPVTLGTGLLALFTLTSISIREDDWFGHIVAVTASSSEVKFFSEFAEAEWVVWLALGGVAAAILAALFFRTEGIQPRQHAAEVGAPLGLFYPTGCFLLDSSGSVCCSGK